MEEPGLGCSAPWPTRAPVPAATREGRWRQDLHYLATNLRRLHADLFFNTKPDEFRDACGTFLPVRSCGVLTLF